MIDLSHERKEVIACGSLVSVFISPLLLAVILCASEETGDKPFVCVVCLGDLVYFRNCPLQC